MNEITQAIEELNRLSVKQICNIKVNYKILGIAIQALEKQMPKQVTDIGYDVLTNLYEGDCICGQAVDSSQEHCHICGQKLSWEDKANDKD